MACLRRVALSSSTFLLIYLTTVLSQSTDNFWVYQTTSDGKKCNLDRLNNVVIFSVNPNVCQSNNQNYPNAGLSKSLRHLKSSNSLPAYGSKTVSCDVNGEMHYTLYSNTYCDPSGLIGDVNPFTTSTCTVEQSGTPNVAYSVTRPRCTATFPVELSQKPVGKFSFSTEFYGDSWCSEDIVGLVIEAANVTIPNYGRQVKCDQYSDTYFISYDDPGKPYATAIQHVAPTCTPLPPNNNNYNDGNINALSSATAVIQRCNWNTTRLKTTLEFPGDKKIPLLSSGVYAGLNLYYDPTCSGQPSYAVALLLDSCIDYQLPDGNAINIITKYDDINNVLTISTTDPSMNAMDCSQGADNIAFVMSQDLPQGVCSSSLFGNGLMASFQLTMPGSSLLSYLPSTSGYEVDVGLDSVEDYATIVRASGLQTNCQQWNPSDQEQGQQYYQQQCVGGRLINSVYSQPAGYFYPSDAAAARTPHTTDIVDTMYNNFCTPENLVYTVAEDYYPYGSGRSYSTCYVPRRSRNKFNRPYAFSKIHAGYTVTTIKYHTPNNCTADVFEGRNVFVCPLE